MIIYVLFEFSRVCSDYPLDVKCNAQIQCVYIFNFLFSINEYQMHIHNFYLFLYNLSENTIAVR